MDLTKLKEIKDKQAADQLSVQRHKDLIVSGKEVERGIIQQTETLVKFLNGHTSKTKVVNQLTKIGTPDALKVIPEIKILANILKTHKNTDLSEVTKLMTSLLEEAKKIPKDLPKQNKQQFVDYTKQFKDLSELVKSLIKVCKEQELVAEAPVVNLPETNVNVEAPNLEPLQDSIRDVVKAVKKIVIPEYKTNNTGVEKLLKKTNKLLDQILNKPVGGGGGGGGGVSSFVGSDGNTTFVTVNTDGSIPVSGKPLALKLDDYTTTNVTYVGKAPTGTTSTSTGVWQIQKIDETTGLVITWADGNSNFDNIWNNRATTVVYS